jgi:aspartyl-tRNA(Asn)/glutamyl-tRNA(Gln) amidotransferase subunit C
MSLSLEEVRRVAALARIEVNEDQARATCDQLNNILGLIGQMQALDTADIEPMAHALDIALRLREDQATEPDQRELFQSIAPRTENGLYLVPKVIE